MQELQTLQNRWHIMQIPFIAIVVVIIIIIIITITIMITITITITIMIMIITEFRSILVNTWSDKESFNKPLILIMMMMLMIIVMTIMTITPETAKINCTIFVDKESRRWKIQHMCLPSLNKVGYYYYYVIASLQMRQRCMKKYPICTKPKWIWVSGRFGSLHALYVIRLR